MKIKIYPKASFHKVQLLQPSLYEQKTTTTTKDTGHVIVHHIHSSFFGKRAYVLNSTVQC